MSKTILICDDDEGILDMLGFVLEENGFRVVQEQNSLKLYNLIDEEKPDLLLLDLWMPVLPGDQILRYLKKMPQTRHIPVVLFSASTEGERIAHDAGADAYISKPFDIYKLVDKLTDLLN